MIRMDLVLFAIAALIGLMLLFKRLRSQSLPLLLALLHGLFAASGLTLVAINFITVPSSVVKLPLVLFILAALGGFVLFSFQLRKLLLPIPLIIVHALVGVTAFSLLLYKTIL